MSVPGFLPEACGAPGDVGTGNPAKEAMLGYCGEAAIGDPNCEWYVMPSRPGGSAVAATAGDSGARTKRLLALQRLSAPPCLLVGDTLSCVAYAYRP